MNNRKNDEIDEMFINYFNNITTIPTSTQNTIDNTIKELQLSPVRTLYSIKKIAIIIISVLVISSTAVFAKEIISFITSLFTTSTEGIDKAVENGYVQNIDMDYIYDNDIGIKIGSLVMDDNTLAISYIYQVNNPKFSDISEITLKEYLIRDENNNLIYYYFENENYMNKGPKLVYHSFRYNFFQHKQEQNTYIDSILYNLYKTPNCHSLQIEIHSLDIYKNNSEQFLNGNWIFNIDLDKMILDRNIQEYSYTYNEYINDISCKLSDTSLILDITLTNKINKDILLFPGNITLTDSFGNPIKLLYIDCKNDNNDLSKIKLTADFSKYSKNIDKLNLFINIDVDKHIETTLIKNK